ncbi:MAG: histidine ammonia-lyase [Bacilli bacterium]|jgi:histidine ammonia-lyase|nr:histidine ammonia-lyase [Bacilli bacterium]MDD3121096.1 histidine ammonia-lyase [Bacilli bacterium]MDD4063766.1 histidine ammonia-lyase [Bacilli bacterium]MDD4482639.1 histidine ammonia-lyase [Bacilli bacterium]MDY0363295.1 histidine ammonia-lyase [Bacilli bacterium]
MIIVDGSSLTLEQLISIARENEKIQISAQSKKRVRSASLFVKEISESDKAVYGINTGFGQLSNVMIEKDKVELLQINLLMSHACGMGEPLPLETVRAMMVLRINALIKGYSGISINTIEQMELLLNENIIPVVFEQGSLGASGDLALLSHMSLPLLGLGEVFYKGERMSASSAYRLAKMKYLTKLGPKEGLSLINGTQAMSAIGAIVLFDALRLLDYANLSLSMTMEALEGVIDAFDPKVHIARGQLGQIEVSKKIISYLENSNNVTRQGEKRVQDAYSLRCAPQVHGAILDAFKHVLDILNREMNAVTDNPLIFSDEKEAISAGNFHGEPLALAFDYMGIAISEIASISERRIERLVNPQLNNGLPRFLSSNSGVNSGFMIVQYTAASLVSENKVLAHPASVDSIPSSANQEDHVSMGSISARKSRDILSNARKVIALEFLTAYQALNFRGKDKLGKRTKIAFDYFSKYIPFIEKDTIMYPFMHKIEELLLNDETYETLFKGDE